MIALRYLRVSTSDQEGGLQMQDQVTKDVCERKNLFVKQVFVDEAISGAVAKREGFDGLQREIISLYKKGEETCIAIYDLSRIGRDPIIGESFIQLCWKNNAQVLDRTGTLHGFDTHEKRLYARMMFAFSTADKEKKNDDSFNGMRNAMRNGRYVFGPTKGYIFAKNAQKLRVMVPIEPEASVVRKVLENYANGSFSFRDVHLFLKKNNLPSSHNHVQIRKLLSNTVYAGFYEYPEWGILRTNGIHEPLITYATWQKIMSRLETKEIRVISIAPVEEFPLKRFLKCSKCDKLMIGYFATGRSRKYKYYSCYNKDCGLYRKNFAGENLETEFVEYLKSLKLSKAVLELARKSFNLHWSKNQKANEKARASNIKESNKIESRIEKLFQQLTETTDQFLVKMYQKQITELNNDKVRLLAEVKEYSDTTFNSQLGFRTAVNEGISILANLDVYWTNGGIEARKSILDLLFKDGFSYHPDLSFRTATLSDFYQLFCLDFNVKLSGGQDIPSTRIINIVFVNKNTVNEVLLNQILLLA